MKIIGIIPARYASTRFPGKALALIHGKSMLQRVYEQATKAKSLAEVIIATDDERIMNHAHEFGAKTVMTKTEHISGTDRCYEAYVLNNKNYDYVLNIQGDEPFLDPEQINSLAAICDGKTKIATQMIKCNDYETLFDAGEVKITLNHKNEAIYFSRNVIPYLKGVNEKQWHSQFNYYRHVGMYAYKANILAEITQLKPSSLEKAESLEQLRWIENGYAIKCAETNFDSHCIDTPGDIEKVLKLLKLI
ncbi:MAG: 3-deoxy-manno-octulosonate cytidylyltransferase [Sphingobacteriaceae bacterium]|nr:3-deoxy-manno-octulosonate cytidylyltransferase [Sphingobacteriaceae bacterium]